MKSQIYKCKECECEVEGDPYLKKSSFNKAMCSMCMQEKRLAYNQYDEYHRCRAICQECYDKLSD